jgi:D-3-phosphoglycerate dehydrogenase
VDALNVRPLSAAALAGFLRPMLSEVNMVSAPTVAKERGITVSESRQESSPVYDSLIRITVTTEMGRRSFAGTVIAGAPRIVEVKGMELDAAFGPSMLYVNNLDKPGFIGALGALLGQAGVNIATFNLGRVAAGEDAIALVGVDQTPDTSLIAKIKALPHVKEARALAF